MGRVIAVLLSCLALSACGGLDDPSITTSHHAITETFPDAPAGMERCQGWYFDYDVTPVCSEHDQSYLDWICDGAYLCTPSRCQTVSGDQACNIDIGSAVSCVSDGIVHCRCLCYKLVP